ncbi:unnamed protein product [Nyctereutes procyonoides]|uniref:(raccoon dog) hypothetical protein n=1 Tax=Nyctereutes procyonoides TaxID=34880 RepID=A0A811Y0R2_NYCPR|nr:unnamed protein product [Nyctereutes procyonoides]
MSADLGVLQMKEEDIINFPAAGTHLSGTNFDIQMEQYIQQKEKIWEKLLLAVHAIIAMKTQWLAVPKFAAITGATPVAGCFTPRNFANQIQAAFWEPRLLVFTDPRADHQPLTEVLMLTCLSSLYGAHSVGVMWMLAQEFLCMCGTIFPEEQAVAEKAVTKEEFQGEWTAPAPESPLKLQTDWSTQQATKNWSATTTAQTTEWVGTITEWS